MGAGPSAGTVRAPGGPEGSTGVPPGCCGKKTFTFSDPDFFPRRGSVSHGGKTLISGRRRNAPGSGSYTTAEGLFLDQKGAKVGAVPFEGAGLEISPTGEYALVTGHLFGEGIEGAQPFALVEQAQRSVEARVVGHHAQGDRERFEAEAQAAARLDHRVLSRPQGALPARPHHPGNQHAP